MRQSGRRSLGEVLADGLRVREFCTLGEIELRPRRGDCVVSRRSAGRCADLCNSRARRVSGGIQTKPSRRFASLSTSVWLDATSASEFYGPANNSMPSEPASNCARLWGTQQGPVPQARARPPLPSAIIGLQERKVEVQQTGDEAMSQKVNELYGRSRNQGKRAG